MSTTHTVPSGTIAASATHATFDLFEYIRSIPNVDVAAQLAQNAAWRIDTLIQSNARQLFKLVREDLFKRDVDGMAELSMALAEQAFAEDAFYESGSTTQGPVTAIKELMLQRDAAHDMAADLTSMTTDWQGRTHVYEIPSLDDVFFREVVLKVKPTTRRRMAISVGRRGKAYDMSADEIKGQIAKRVEREEDRLRDISSTVQDQSNAVFVMFQLACIASVDVEIGEHFHTMDIASQRALIDSAIIAADREEDRATSNNNLTDAEFDDIGFTVLKINKELGAVLKSSKFRVQAQQIAAAEANVG